MTVKELTEKLGLETVSAGNGDARVSGCYCSDLLSHCMSNIRASNVWVTVQANINIVAIAVLTELSCIIIAQNMPVDEKVIQKAKEEDVSILRSAQTAYELCVGIGKLI